MSTQVFPIKNHVLPARDGHSVAFSEHGNPEGPSIIVFHGGPGNKSKLSQAERFDLSKYRVILFDQRGCGKSTPLGELTHNTTDDLLADAEATREQLGIKQWFVSGNSWGSTLALLYALKHTDRTLGLLIGAIFLADRDSVAWSMMDEQGVVRLMPDVWEKRLEFFKRFNIGVKTQNEDLLRALDQASFTQKQEIAAGVQNWEGNLMSPFAEVAYKSAEAMTEEDIASVRVFLHYEMNHSFIPEHYILDHVSKLGDLPAVLVHGRYDILCPLHKAHELASSLPKSELIIVPSSGHKLTAEGELIQKLAYDRFLKCYC